MSKQAAIYIRTSTERQKEKVSPQAQEDDCRELCAKKGYQVVEVYRDIEKYRVGSRLVEPSGTRADRPALKRMLADCRAGNFQVIVAWREDRLYRSFRPMLDVLDCLSDTGADIELAKEAFDKKIAPVKAWAANMELEAKHDRFMMGVAGRLEKGLPWIANPPYGYAKDELGGLVEYDVESSWVLKIWTWFGEGETGREIRRRLITGGAPQRKQVKYAWALANIYQFLRYEPYYTGAMTIKWDGQIYDIPLVPIIPADIAAQVVARKAAFKRHKSGNLKALTLAPGLVYCFGCNHKMQVVSRKIGDREYYYYRCINPGTVGQALEGCCSSVKMGRVDAEIWEKVWVFVAEPERFEAALEEQIAILQAQEFDAESECDRLGKALDEITMERQKIITWGRKEIITETDMETQLLALSFQENGMRRELFKAQLLSGDKVEKLIHLAQDYRAKVKAGVEAINSLAPESAAEQLAFRREIVEAIVTRVDVLADKSVKVHVELSFVEQLPSLQWQLTDIQNYCFALTL